MIHFGVNVDHIATVRQSRGTDYPDPVVAALMSEYAGADSIVVHLREDRRHIQERDVVLIKQAISVPLNLEMSVNKDIVAFACQVQPQYATLVPERRREVTTEGGLDLEKNFRRIERTVRALQEKQIQVSLFVDPLKKNIAAAQKLHVARVELSTARYCQARTEASGKKERDKIARICDYAAQRGLYVAAGHGLDYENVTDIASIAAIQELNIGHSIISRALFVGMVAATSEMATIIRQAAGKGRKR